MSGTGSRTYGGRPGEGLRSALERGASTLASKRADRIATAGLVLAMIAAAATLLVLQRDLTYFNDEYGWLATSSDLRPETLLMPHNSHLIALPRLLYEALPELLGPAHVVFAIVSAIGVLLCAGLFFVFARRRIGGPAALAPTLVLLFFGSSWDVVLATVGIPALLSIAAGLGALVALDRADRRGDVAVAVLLGLSLASHSFGPVFVVGVATYLLLRPDRWQRAWIFAVPAVLYAAWWVWALRYDQGIVSAANVPGLPRYVADSLGAGLAALSGLNSNFGGPGPPATQPTTFFTQYNLPLAVLASLALALRLWLGRRTPWLWALLALVLAYWLAIGLSAAPARQPEAARYLYPSAAMILLVAVEALRGVRIGWIGLALLFAGAAISLAGNLTHLRNSHDFLAAQGEAARAQLAMIELAGTEGDLGLSPSDVGPAGARYVGVPALFYLAAVDRVGSLADDLPEVRAAPEPVREAADLVLARSLGVEVAADPGATPGRCKLQAAGEPFELSAGTNLLQGGAAEAASLLVGRFADTPTVPVGELSGSGAFEVALPGDSAPDPWLAQADAPVRVCR